MVEPNRTLQNLQPLPPLTQIPNSPFGDLTNLPLTPISLSQMQTPCRLFNSTLGIQSTPQTQPPATFQSTPFRPFEPQSCGQFSFYEVNEDGIVTERAHSSSQDVNDEAHTQQADISNMPLAIQETPSATANTPVTKRPMPVVEKVFIENIEKMLKKSFNNRP